MKHCTPPGTRFGEKEKELLILTRELLFAVTDNDKKKPNIYKLYNFTKCGRDIVDQKMGSYNVNCPENEPKLLSYLLDTIRVNSNTVFALSKELISGKWIYFEFGLALAESLVKLFV